jgi:hypothetical protein
MPDTVQSLFTFASIATFGGASAAVAVIANTYRRFRKSDSSIPAFVASLAVSFVGAYTAKSWLGIGESFLIVLNACLLFCSAAGMNEVALTAAQAPPPGGVQPHGLQPVPWLSSWFRRVL